MDTFDANWIGEGDDSKTSGSSLSRASSLSDLADLIPSVETSNSSTSFDANFLGRVPGGDGFVNSSSSASSCDECIRKYFLQAHLSLWCCMGLGEVE